MKVHGENGGVWLTVEGHNDGTFGLDRRRYFDDDGRYRFGYCVTHLLTGYAVRYVRAPLATAKQFVEALHVTNWDFDDPKKGQVDPRRRLAAKAACEICDTSTGFGFDPAARSERTEA